MTEAEQRQAELDKIDAERKRKEALLLLLLLGYVEQSRRVVNGSVRAGYDPLAAIRRVFTGNGTAHFPGAAPKLANGLADIDQAARGMALDGLPATTPSIPPPTAQPGIPTTPRPIVSLPVLPSKIEIAKQYRPFANQTVAEMENNVSAMVSDVLARAHDAGASINAIITTMREAFAAKGWTPNSPGRLANQAVTMAATAWAAGSYAGWRTPGIWNAIKGFEYVAVHDLSGQPDKKVCPICKPLDGLKLPRDDPRWASLWVPRHYVCRCLIRPLYVDFKPSTVPQNLPPAGVGFGMIPSAAPGFSAFGTL